MSFFNFRDWNNGQSRNLISHFLNGVSNETNSLGRRARHACSRVCVCVRISHARIRLHHTDRQTRTHIQGSSKSLADAPQHCVAKQKREKGMLASKRTHTHAEQTDRLTDRRDGTGQIVTETANEKASTLLRGTAWQETNWTIRHNFLPNFSNTTGKVRSVQKVGRLFFAFFFDHTRLVE